MNAKERRELLKSVYEQNWLHARHLENERLWFTNIYVVIVGGLLAYTFGTEGTHFWPWPILLVIFILSLAGLFMCNSLRIPFYYHSRMADIIQKKEWRFPYHYFYRGKKDPKAKGRFRFDPSKVFHFHAVFYWFYTIMSSFSFVFFLYELISWRIGLIGGLLCFGILYGYLQKISFERAEKEAEQDLQELLGRSSQDDNIIFREGKDAIEEFKGERKVERGIKWRIKHDVLGISLHDAELLEGLQEGHKHAGLYEGIMLLEGKIKALWWDDEGAVEVKSLLGRGDLVIIPPAQSHTLIVEEDSRVIVVRFPHSTEMEGKREKVTLPGRLEELRKTMLETESKTKQILDALTDIEALKKQMLKKK